MRELTKDVNAVAAKCSRIYYSVIRFKKDKLEYCYPPLRLLLLYIINGVTGFVRIYYNVFITAGKLQRVPYAFSR